MLEDTNSLDGAQLTSHKSCTILTIKFNTLARIKTMNLLIYKPRKNTNKINEPRHDKNLFSGVSDQVRHKPACEATEAS